MEIWSLRRCAVAHHTADREIPMRALMVFCIGCIMLVSPSHSATVKSADEAAMMRLEAISDRSPEEWQGRQHYLYDEDYQPGEETVGSAGSNPLACSDERVQLRRSDGRTVIRRLNRC
jgi:hypothetical protein